MLHYLCSAAVPDCAGVECHRRRTVKKHGASILQIPSPHHASVMVLPKARFHTRPAQLLVIVHEVSVAEEDSKDMVPPELSSYKPQHLTMPATPVHNLLPLLSSYRAGRTVTDCAGGECCGSPIERYGTSMLQTPHLSYQPLHRICCRPFFLPVQL